MRQVRIAAIDWWPINGTAVSIPVVVDWPELQLTDDQIAANGIAKANGEPEPFPNHAIFDVVIERPVPRVQKHPKAHNCTHWVPVEED